MDNKNFNLNQYDSNERSNEVIDLGKIINSVLRRKILVLCFSLLGFSSGIFYGNFKKEVWEGSFQIVLESQSSSSDSVASNLLPASNNAIRSQVLSSLGSPKDALKTEVLILKSPSVLKPVFDFVKETKESQGINTDDFRYYKWLRNLNVELKRFTSVLDLSYRDTDKSLIIPVLNKVSSIYQDYSGRDRKKGLSQSINFLENQLQKMEIKSSLSMKEYQEYAIENKMGTLDRMPLMLKSFSDNSREEEEIQARSSDSFTLQSQKLATLEAQLLEKSAYLKPNSRIIRDIRSKIDLINKSLTRPKEVLLKHRELLGRALKDEQTLVAIEDQLFVLKLNNARTKDPWELISKPTLIDESVAPRKNFIAFFGLLFGTIIGFAFSIVLDKKYGYIYEIKDLKRKLNFPLLKRFRIESKERWINSIKLIVDLLDSNKSDRLIGLIPIGNVNKNGLELFKNQISKSLNDQKLIISSNFVDTNECYKRILIISSESVTYDELDSLIEEFNLQEDNNILGWVYLED